MLNIEASKERVLSFRAATSPRQMPAIVWRSASRHASAGAGNPGRLHLVAAPPLDRFALQRRRRTMLRDRVVECAYIAAALGTAIVIWWSAR